jgi:hypothetical protein
MSAGRSLVRASHCGKAQPIDLILLLNFVAERYWVQNAMTQILAIVWVPSWFHTYSILFPRRAQYVECTQYMATRTAIVTVGIFLNQCLKKLRRRKLRLVWRVVRSVTRGGALGSHAVSNT